MSRRRFLGGGLALGGAGALGGLAVAGCTTQDAASSVETGAGALVPSYVPFFGSHQPGITTRVPAAGLIASFDVTAHDPMRLADALRALTDEARRMMEGKPYEERDSAFPARHAGTLGRKPPPADLSVIVAVGASLFDGRFGLAAKRPRELVAMTKLANDRLDRSRMHGDVLLTISADTPDVCLFALRQLMRRTRDALVLRWMADGFNRRDQPQPGRAGVRNLMGFRDGTANLDHSDAAMMRKHVWVGPGDGEPAWAAGGSYQAVRLIRMFVEFWDRTPIAEQQTIMGRRKESGAPLDGKRETDVPDYAADPKGKVTPLDAHIRLANPRTKETEENLILRRGFSFSRGFDGAGRLDQGLAFVSFQRSLERGFLAVQARLAGEPLEEYIEPQGGGFYFALPGVRSAGGFLGEGLFA